LLEAENVSLMIIDKEDLLARMPVPKLVKNGFYSSSAPLDLKQLVS
jgi:hypothetical protein